MAWRDTRSSVREGTAAARTVAHADDAKSRTDEASQLARRGFPRKVLVGAALAALVVVAVVVVVLQSGDSEKQPVAAAPSPGPAPSEVLEQPSPADELAQSQPSGVWRAQVIGRTRILRDGSREPLTSKEKATRWTFTSQNCTDSSCLGTVSSTTGADFPYTWNGRKLVVERGVITDKGNKVACVDNVTGVPSPISEAAAIDTFTYSYGPFNGTPDQMTSKLKIKVETEYFGTCAPTPKDTVGFLEDQVITPLEG